MKKKSDTAHVVDRVMNIIGMMQNIFSIVPLVLMCFIVLASVIMRYVLHIPFTWGEEAARYLMIFASMLAIGMGVREKSHLGVTMFVSILPSQISIIVSAFAQLLNLVIYVILSIISWQFIIAQYKFGQLSAALKLPMYLVYGMMLLGFAFSSIETLYVFWKDYILKEPLEAKEENI